MLKKSSPGHSPARESSAHPPDWSPAGQRNTAAPSPALTVHDMLPLNDSLVGWSFGAIRPLRANRFDEDHQRSHPADRHLHLIGSLERDDFFEDGSQQTNFMRYDNHASPRRKQPTRFVQ